MYLRVHISLELALAKWLSDQAFKSAKTVASTDLLCRPTQQKNYNVRCLLTENIKGLKGLQMYHHLAHSITEFLH
jgi:hypothetical protein